MRIGTWNVEYAVGAAKNARRREVLKQHGCDVWVLTETSDVLDLSGRYIPVHSAPRPNRPSRSRWVTIWSRYPILEIPRVVDPRRTVCALLAAPSGPLLIFGTVMPWATDYGDEPVSSQPRNWSEHHRVMAQQGEEWVALREAYPAADLCAAGDLNTDIGGQPFYGTAVGRGLLREAMSRTDLFCATETARIPAGALAHPPIDHVLLPTKWETRTTVAAAWEGKATDGVRLSDHSGLVVEIEERSLARAASSHDEGRQERW